ncbi:MULTISPECIES: C40 family peptidase [Comamonas]|jgi:NlpC/P60 family|uniref:C40 family peptidase n=1 Tax=Comamonas sediminis TaxID=1783360 RepID=A0ABV4B160_9BURK|nr:MULTISPECIES: C40 family peptidase [unclassified Comamonas]ULR90625.1 C40 family peptidase [Comamonas sp. B21-038]
MSPKWICTLIVAASVSAHAAPESEHKPSDLDLLLGIGQSSLSKLDSVHHQVKDQANVLISNALGLIGVPYRRGGNSAETGFDCSGLVRAVYAESWGKILPRRAEEQAAATDKIEKAELKPGDLVFFNTMRRAFSHVGIYMGDGKFIHSPRTGKTVRVESMDIAYWEKRFDGARRVELSEEARTKLMQQVNLDGAEAQDLIGRVMSKANMRVN